MTTVSEMSEQGFIVSPGSDPLLDFIGRNPGLTTDAITFRLGCDASAVEDLARRGLIYWKDGEGWKLASYSSS